MGMLLGGMSPKGKKPTRGWGRWVPAAAQGTAGQRGARACTGAERGTAGLGPRVLLEMTPGSPPRPPQLSPTPKIRSLGMGSCPDLSLITPRTSWHPAPPARRCLPHTLHPAWELQ